jgi:hypothetical protein
MYSQALSLCAKVKERLSSAEDYQTFLKCLHDFSNGIIKKNDLQNMVCASFSCIFADFGSLVLCSIPFWRFQLYSNAMLFLSRSDSLK